MERVHGDGEATGDGGAYMSGVHNRQKYFCFKWQRRRCWICNKKMAIHVYQRHADFATVDHIIPQSKGGKKERNFLLAHQRCNSLRGSSSPPACALMAARFMREAFDENELFFHEVWRAHNVQRIPDKVFA